VGTQLNFIIGLGQPETKAKFFMLLYVVPVDSRVTGSVVMAQPGSGLAPSFSQAKPFKRLVAAKLP